MANRNKTGRIALSDLMHATNQSPVCSPTRPAPMLPLPHFNNENIAPITNNAKSLVLPPISSIAPKITPVPVPVLPAAATAPDNPTTASRKRKSTDSADGPSSSTPTAPAEKQPTLFDLEDIDIGNYAFPPCDTIRRQIFRFLDSGVMTKKAFSDAIGVSAKSLNGFLGTTGRNSGSNFNAYGFAAEYFRKREAAKIPFPSKSTSNGKGAEGAAGGATAAAGAGATKKRKTGGGEGSSASAVATVDISDVHLEGEETDSVPIYETCDEVRRKINDHMKKPGITQAQFCRDMYAQLKGEKKPAGIQGTQLANFRSKRGPSAGATSIVFYAAYVYFEKIRVKQGKTKTARRLEMEKLYAPKGFDRESDGSRGYLICLSNERPHEDSYGRVHFY